MLQSQRSARCAQRSPLVGVVVALGFAASSIACAYPVDDFTSASSSTTGDVGSTDAPPLTDPRSDSNVASDDTSSSATSSGGSSDPSGSSGGSSSDDGKDDSHDHGHGKKKGGDR